MASASNTAAFVIFHREKKGKPDRIFSYKVEEAKHLLLAINIYKKFSERDVFFRQG